MCSVERRGGGVFEESRRGTRRPVVRRANAQKTLVRRRGSLSWSQRISPCTDLVRYRVFSSGGACGRSEYPCQPPARPMAAAVAVATCSAVASATSSTTTYKVGCLPKKWVISNERASEQQLVRVGVPRVREEGRADAPTEASDAGGGGSSGKETAPRSLIVRGARMYI